MNFTQNTKLWYQDLLYRLLKALMQIHSNPKKEDLFRVCLGMSIDEYTDGLSMQALLRLKQPEQRTEEENKRLDEWLEKKKESWKKLKKILYSEAQILAKLNLEILFPGWLPKKKPRRGGVKPQDRRLLRGRLTPQSRARLREANAPTIHLCKCEEHLTQEHALSDCPHCQAAWAQAFAKVSRIKPDEDGVTRPRSEQLAAKIRRHWTDLTAK